MSENKAIDFDFKIEDGKLKVIVNHDGNDAGVKVEAYVNSDRLLDKLEQAIPGDWDKGVILILKAAIANVKV